MDTEFNFPPEKDLRLLTKNLAVITENARLDQPELVASLDPDKSRPLLRLHQTPVPLEASAPQMSLDKLTHRLVLEKVTNTRLEMSRA